MDQYLAMILQWAGNFAPAQFTLCNGQLLAISTNTALFALLGTSYGGNGSTTFGLPDLRGRVAVGQGTGAGLSTYDIGEQVGTETISVLSGNLPIHNHSVNGTSATASSDAPANNYFAVPPKKGSGPQTKSPDFYAASTTPNMPLNFQSVSTNLGGSGVPMSILQPTLAISYIIALQGTFPPRN